MDNNGHIFEQQFKEFGNLGVEFVKDIKSPQLITYYFNLKNIANYSKSRIEKILEKLSAYNHRELKFIETYESHFGVVETLSQREPLFLSSLEFKPNNSNNIKIPIGKDLNNKVVNLDFDKIPHILIAGTTGSGKSVLLNDIICSLYATTHQNNFDLTIIDPKQIDFAHYSQISNVNLITSTNDAISYLNNLCSEMDYRYQLLKEKGLTDYHGTMKPRFIIIDELADLMLTSRYEVEESIVRLAQKSRAIGFHLIVATQRPSVNVVSGTIKTNLPCKIALKTASSRDSVVIMDRGGAEKLLGFGDAYLIPTDSPTPIRFQCAYCSTEKQKQLIEMVKAR